MDGTTLSASAVDEAVALARRLLTRARELQTSAERRQQAELDRMIQSPGDRATLVEITDQAFRAAHPGRAADQLIHILDVQGVPRFFSPLERTLLKGFQTFGGYLPGVAMPLVQERIEHETANVVLPAEEELLREYLQARRADGLRMNVNFLGEALLGEGDAERRLQSYLAALQRPEIEVVSVKISTIYSQISALARDETVEVLSDRLELLFRAAAKSRFERAGGAIVPKFVYLDMEEYRDKEITAEAFMRTLDRPGLGKAAAGIALQAYIPDSFATQRRLTEWARKRVAAGGAPVTIRLVKGANMEMERVEASIRGWPLAPFDDKRDTDANYHRMLRYGMQPENLAAVRLGVASHNLFTLAYGLVLAARSELPDAAERVQFEMLEGMANHQRRALAEEVKNVLLYAPASRKEDFTSAIGYLVRRLDENTGPDNFLRHAFNLEVDSDDWRRLERGFVESFARIESLSEAPQRTQNRGQESGIKSQESEISAVVPPNHRPLRAGPSPAPAAPEQTPGAGDGPARFRRFSNEPDTDWSLPQNGRWAAGIIETWQPRSGERAADVPLVICGEEIREGRPAKPSHDPSRPGVVVANYRQATIEDVDRAVKCAASDPDGWRCRTSRERTEILDRVADVLARSRGELMGAMLAEGGKVFGESDPEVSEAIDFCRFYSRSAEELHGNPGVAARAKGVVVVVSPWNFPLAIPCGGVAAALAAGNTVLLKPASDTVLIAYLLCECFWRAGVAKSALQFVPCRGADVAPALVGHAAVDAVILTGGTATALDMLRRTPAMNLLAETGGKNATIVTALSDRDSAIKNVLHSAFSHSGQKCSATSLLILEDEVYHDPRFRETLCDAVESLAVGSAWRLPTKIGPLIRPPSGELERGLKELEPGETWAVMPRLHVDGNPNLVSPGVKWGVANGGFTHCTELFGPVLGVMKARNLHEAIDLVNATGYGLTSGLESLDDREHELWKAGVRAGNLYINRSTTGAIVLRQPFGGMGKSAFGAGAKAGGPNYVAPLVDFVEAESREHGAGRGPASQLRARPSSAAVNQASPAPAEAATTLASEQKVLDERRDQLDLLRTGLADDEVARLAIAVDSYLEWAEREFAATHDHFHLLGEDNLRRYLPVEGLWIRVHADDSPFEIFARAAAARAAGCRSVISFPPDLAGRASEAVRRLDQLTDLWAGAIEFVEESDEQLVMQLAGPIDRLRYAGRNRVPRAVRRAAAESLVYIADAPVLAHGRVELLWYVREQSISHLYHRYGNLGRRGGELTR